MRKKSSNKGNGAIISCMFRRGGHVVSFLRGGIMVQDHFLNHLEGGKRLLHHHSFLSTMPNNDDLFTDDDWSDFLPTKAVEYDHGFCLPDGTVDPVMPKCEPPPPMAMEDDWESLISNAVNDTESKTVDLLEMALQESKANEPEFSSLPIEPVQFTFDPLSFALSQESLSTPSILSPEPTPQLQPTLPPVPEPLVKKKLTTAEILQATLDKNRTALAMKNASQMLRATIDIRKRAPFSLKNSQFKPVKKIIPTAIAAPTLYSPVAPMSNSKTSIIKLSKGNVILQIPPNINCPPKVNNRSNPRSLLVSKKPTISLQKPKMVKILDPKTKTFKLIKLCAS
uniref:Uncharacterized protein n=2 Tax=Lepeophtheirus salmonis TaxID=72036 RepID=A0A0K2TM19_LEPSM